MHKYLIKSSLGFLDGQDNDENGRTWEWTQDRRTAWRLDKAIAERKLIQVLKDVPDAKLETVGRSTVER